MSSANSTRRRQSIVVPILLLVVASVAVAAFALFAVTFRGPPAPPEPQPIALIANLLKGGKAPDKLADWQLRVETVAEPPAPHPRERLDPVASQLLADQLGVPESDVAVWRDPWRNAPTGSISMPFMAKAKINGVWHVAFTPPPSFLTRWHWSTLLTMAGLLAALSALGWLIARAISRPLRELARAAARARAGAPLAPLPTRAPREVAELGEALAAMHSRLANHAEGRTAMLAAIAHDLGTPLSRLAFWVEQLPEQARARAEADVDEMRSMIAAAIGYARDEMQMRADARVELGSLLDSLVEDMKVSGVEVAIAPGPRTVVRGDPAALRRAFANLIDNAVRYSQDGGRATVKILAGPQPQLCISDDGPHIPVEERKRIFERFHRMLGTKTDGSGLGLAIVSEIASLHKAQISLEEDRDGVGNTFTILFPTPKSEA